MSMDARKGNIYEILNGSKQFIIPVYQRYYSWDIEQCKRLWDDIVEIQESQKNGHFVGSIVNIVEQATATGAQKFMIIDGQQRMTTLTLLMLALRDYLAKDPNPIIKPEKIENDFLKNLHVPESECYKLLLGEQDKDTLISLIEKSKKKETSARIINNYEFFMQKIEEGILSPIGICECIGKLQIVNITLDRTLDDPQAIFESMNSTGKELSQSDLIRNYMLMKLNNKEQTHIYRNIWHPMESLFDNKKQDLTMDKFFRDYLTTKLGRIPNINRIYDEFKSYRSKKYEFSISDLSKDLSEYAIHYTDMIYCREKDNDTVLISLYKDMQSLKMEVAYPFLLKVHNDYKQDRISKNDLKEIIKMCINYVLRRNICDIPTNSMNKTFVTLCREIKDGDYLNSIKAFFILSDSYREFPNDERFINAFISKDIYNMRTRNFILAHLENFNNKEPIIIENYTIEHIMPQNKNLNNEWKSTLGDNYTEVQKKYLHTIGNLTLTAYNSEMSDKSFQEKLHMKGGFIESGLRINDFIRKQTHWNEKTIQDRAREIAKIACMIWDYPDLAPEKLESYIEKNNNPERDLDFYNFNDSTRVLFETLDKRIMNLSSDVKRELKKYYIAYKLDTNFADVEIQKQRVCIRLNIKFTEINDPYQICRDTTDLGRWGNRSVELFFDQIGDIDKVIEMIKQSYQLQIE